MYSNAASVKGENTWRRDEVLFNSSNDETNTLNNAAVSRISSQL